MLNLVCFPFFIFFIQYADYIHKFSKNVFYCRHVLTAKHCFRRAYKIGNKIVSCKSHSGGAFDSIKTYFSIFHLLLKTLNFVVYIKSTLIIFKLIQISIMCRL